LGEKIDKEVNPEMVQIKGAKRRAPLREVKRGKTAIINYHLGWINDDSKRC
jgi:hypothetical protein